MKRFKDVWFEQIGSGTFKFEIDGKKVITHNSSLYEDLCMMSYWEKNGMLDDPPLSEKETLFYDDPIGFLKGILNNPELHPGDRVSSLD